MSNEFIDVGQVRSDLEQGNFEQAFAGYEKALRSGSPEIKVEFAFLLWKCFEFSRARELFLELVEDSRTSLPHLQAIAKCHFSHGRFSEAAKVMKQAVQRSPNNVELLLQLASTLERSDQIPASIEICSRGLSIEPGHQGLVRQMAHIERREGNLNGAIDRLVKFLAEFSTAGKWQIQYELAGCLDRSGEYRDAWQNLLDAKTELRQQTLTDLKTSYEIRRRQAEVVQSITEVDWRRWHRTPISNPQSIAFMAGFPRSGTTLLETIMTSHSQVEGTDESGIFASQFTRPIVWEAADSMQAVIELRGFEGDQLTTGREHYLRCTRNVLGTEIQNKTLIEKDPLLTCDLALPLRLFPEARIIMPLRDPRDVVISYFFTMLPFGWNSSPATDIIESARFYSDVMNHWIFLKDRIPWESMEIRYENLILDPSGESTRLSNFLNLQFESSMLDHSRRRKDKMISTPTYDDVTKPIYRRALGRWENYKEFLEPALPVLEPFCKAFGY